MRSNECTFNCNCNCNLKLWLLALKLVINYNYFSNWLLYNTAYSMLMTLNCSCKCAKHLHSSCPWLVPEQSSLTQRWQVRCCCSRYRKSTASRRRCQFRASCQSLVTCFNNSQVIRCHPGTATDLRLTHCRNSQGLQLYHIRLFGAFNCCCPGI